MKYDNLAHSQRLINQYADALELRAAKGSVRRLALQAGATVSHGPRGDDPPSLVLQDEAIERFAALTTTGKLQRLLARCKHSVSIEFNDHRDMYKSAEQALDDLDCLECPPRISDEVRAKIIATDTIVELHIYPDTAIGSYYIVHHDLDKALDIALMTMGL